MSWHIVSSLVASCRLDCRITTIPILHEDQGSITKFSSVGNILFDSVQWLDLSSSVSNV